jgi:DNA polymerase
MPTNCIESYWPKQFNGIAIVGEAPGAEEERVGRPFVGPSGKLLYSVFEDCGESFDECFITNTILWRPPGNRTPSDKEIDADLTRLWKELTKVEAKVIISVGKAAYYALVGNHRIYADDIGKRVGSGLIEGAVVYPIYHPAYILRQRNKENAWREGLAAAIAAAKG